MHTSLLSNSSVTTIPKSRKVSSGRLAVWADDLFTAEHSLGANRPD